MTRNGKIVLAVVLAITVLLGLAVLSVLPGSSDSDSDVESPVGRVLIS